MDSCVIWGEEVYKQFGQTVVFNGADWCFGTGLSVLWAPNGMGKSTLIKLSLGILRPNKGRAGLRIDKSRVGLMIDYQDLPSSIRVDRFAVYSSSIRGVKLDWAQFTGILELLGLDASVLKKKIGELSSGMTRKLLVALALTGNPSVVVLDEPFSAMDPYGRIKLSRLINREIRDKVFLVASHVMSLLRPDNVYTIYKGRVVGPVKLPVKEEVTAIAPDKTVHKVPVDLVDDYMSKGYTIIDT